MDLLAPAADSPGMRRVATVPEPASILLIAYGIVGKPSAHIAVGTEPYALALTPSGTGLYVANARSDTLIVDTATNQVTRSPSDRARAARFLRSIDAAGPPVP